MPRIEEVQRRRGNNMKMEKVVSIYNLQDEQELATILGEKENLDYRKISSESCGGEEGVRYQFTMGKMEDAAEFWDIFTRLFKQDSNIRMRVCNPE